MKLDVDVLSDVICPWCFLGKRRLEKAVAVLEGQHEFRVRWLPFQLNPAMPKEGLRRQELAHASGDRDAVTGKLTRILLENAEPAVVNAFTPR